MCVRVRLVSGWEGHATHQTRYVHGTLGRGGITPAGNGRQEHTGRERGVGVEGKGGEGREYCNTALVVHSEERKHTLLKHYE